MSDIHKNMKKNCAKNKASSSQGEKLIVFFRLFPFGGTILNRTDDFDSEDRTLARLYDEILNTQEQLSAWTKDSSGTGKNVGLHDEKYNHLAAGESDEDFQFNKGASISKDELLLLYAAGRGNSKAVKILFKKGVDVDVVEANGRKPIHLAAMGGHQNTIDILLNKGANINGADKMGRTPLHYATRNDKLGVVKRLANKGADINVADTTSDGEKPIHTAAMRGYEDLIDFFLSKGASVNDTDNKGWTPLHYAAFQGELGASKILVEKKADVNAAEMNGRKPIHLAAEGGYEDVMDFLLSKNATVDDTDKNGWTPLHYAACQGELEAAKFLTNERANVNAKASTSDGKKPIHLAAENDHKYMIEFLLSKGASVNDVDNNGWAPLHYAASQEKLEAVKFLTDKGGDVNAKVSTSDGKKPIHFAAQNGNKDMTEFLLSKGASVNDVDNNGWTPLHYAAYNGQLKTVEFLTDKRADVNAKVSTSDGKKPIHLAAENDQKDIIDFLISKGASVNDVDNNGWTPLHYAAYNGQLKTVKFLTDKGADANAKVSTSDGKKPIHLAAENDHKDIIDFLISKGASVNDVDNNGWTPLRIAASHGKLEAAKFLTDKGADVNAKVSTSHGKKPIHSAAIWGHKDMIEYLLSKGASVNDVDDNGWTPLHHAAYNGRLNAVKFLIDKGADIKVSTSDGKKPIHLAAENHHKDMIEFLLSKGASVNDVDNNGWTPLHYAASQGELEAVKFLTDKGANVNAKNSIGRQSIHLAAANGHKNIIDFLFSKGASVNDVDNYGWTPLLLAAYLGKLNAAKSLTDKGANVKAKLRISSNRQSVHLAAENGDKDVIDYLLSKGASVKDVDDNGWTPLRVAAYHGKLEAVKFLADKEARRGRRSIESQDSTEDVNIVKLQEVVENNVQNPAELNSVKIINQDAARLEPISHKLGAKSGNLGSGRNRHYFSGKKTEVKLTGQSVNQVTISSTHTAQDEILNGHKRENARPRLEALADKELPSKVGSSRATHSSWINNFIFGRQDSAGNLLVSKNASTEEKSKADISISQPLNVNGTILLLDLLTRKVTGENQASLAKISFPTIEAQQFALNITAKFKDALEQAALNSGISMHRLDIDFVDLQKEITRKAMIGRFEEILSLVKSYIDKACDGKAAGSGKLSSKKFQNLKVEIDNALDVILTQELLQNENA